MLKTEASMYFRTRMFVIQLLYKRLLLYRDISNITITPTRNNYLKLYLSSLETESNLVQICDITSSGTGVSWKNQGLESC